MCAMQRDASRVPRHARCSSARRRLPSAPVSQEHALRARGRRAQAEAALPAGCRLLLMSAVLRRGAGAGAPPMARPGEAGAPADPMVGLLYTSGSTGLPKGAVYTDSVWRRYWRAGCGRSLPCPSARRMLLRTVGSFCATHQCLQSLICKPAMPAARRHLLVVCWHGEPATSAGALRASAQRLPARVQGRARGAQEEGGERDGRDAAGRQRAACLPAAQPPAGPHGAAAVPGRGRRHSLCAPPTCASGTLGGPLVRAMRQCALLARPCGACSTGPGDVRAHLQPLLVQLAGCLLLRRALSCSAKGR